MIAYYEPPDGTTSGRRDHWNKFGNNDPDVTFIAAPFYDPFESKSKFHPFGLYMPKPEEQVPKVLLLNILILCILINRHCGGYQKNAKRRVWTGYNFCKRPS